MYDKESGEEKERESKWRILKTEYTEGEKRKVLRKVIEIGIKTLMRNHIYQFEGKTSLQKEGGSIGLAATGTIARIRMMRWSRSFKSLVKTNKLELMIFKVYVDDENQLWRVM